MLLWLKEACFTNNVSISLCCRNCLIFVPAVEELFKNVFLIHRAEIITAAIVPIDSCIYPPVLVVVLVFLLRWVKEMFAHMACSGTYFCSCLRSHIELNLAVMFVILSVRH